MSKKELTAYELGNTFDINLIPEGFKIVCCFDERLHSLISKTGSSKNLKIMEAWYKGFNNKYGMC